MKFHVQRSIVIDAPLKKVKELVQDFHQWPKWSPWNIVEPDCKMSFDGKAGTVGHSMSWDGKVIGAGTNTLAKIDETSLSYDLRFISPYKSQSTTRFLFKKTDGGTKVTWTMNGSMPFFLFFMIPKMKGWIAMDYDRGLTMLKELAEKGKIDAQTTQEGTKTFKGFSYVGLERSCTTDKVAELMAKDFEKIIADVVVKHGKAAKHWVSLYPKMDMKNMTMTYIAAVSDEELGDVDLGDDYVRGEIDSGKVLEIKHRGAYTFLGNAWSMGMMYLRYKKYKQRGIPFEQYWNSPHDVEPHELETSVFLPIQ